MSDIVVIGTDTDAGKTTFSLLWVSAFKHDYSYWKPLETGASDTELVRRLVPRVRVIPPADHFDEAVAPPLAARNAGRAIPPAREIAEKRPQQGPCAIETFGGPFSPLNETELQIELVRELAAPVVLVTGSQVGAIGRTLATLRAVREAGVAVSEVVLIGSPDAYAIEQIEKHGGLRVTPLRPPPTWDEAGVSAAADEHHRALTRLY